MKSPTLFAAVAAVCLASVSTASAMPQQGKAKQAPKKAAVQKPTTRPVLGTAQLPGDNGKLNQAYTMGQTRKVNFTLTGARYTKTRWTIDGRAAAPDKTTKLLVLSFSIQNPNPEITNFNMGTLKFTAIDQENVNHEYEGMVIQKAEEKNLTMDLKPAQKIECETVIVVPAKGVVPKLMVAHDTGGGVLRYDLRPIVQKLDKPFSEDGATAVETINAEKDAYYPLMHWDVKYLSTAISEKRFGNWTISDNKVFVLAKFQIKKASKTGYIARFRAELISEDGDRYDDQGMKKASLEEGANGPTEFGQEMNVRMAFAIPKGVKIAKLRIWEDQSKSSTALEFPIEMVATMDGK
ncbi:hypothetical protein EON82_14465 [bacterium]|nr:MAG: hypothetical protein EON82_14465 [bacterium]